MDNRTILFALHEMSGVGWKTIQQLITRYPNLQQLLYANHADLIRCGIAQTKAVSILQQLNESFVQQRITLYNALQVQIMTWFDQDYPELLKQMPQPPWVLYGKGNFALLNKPLLAMVGTRSPTTYGHVVTDQLAHGLTEYGFGIVSGLARGIDSSAHKGALRGNGLTVAVLGCGIGTVYPKENAKLHDEIVRYGVVVSEYPAETPMHPGLFPLRNRIIAGLSLGTIVVEATMKSGSLITADQALEASRDVFAVPGPITSPKSLGSLALIKQGAKLITTVEDIIEEYKHYITLDNHTYINQTPDRSEMSEDESKVYELLSVIPVTIDHLIEQSGLPFGLLHSVLISLLMKKKIQQLPGSAYVTV